MVDLVIGPEFTTLATPEQVAAALVPGRRGQLLLAAPVPLRPSATTASRSTNGAATDGAAAIAIGSANSIPAGR